MLRRQAGGRKNRAILGYFLGIVRCPVKFKYYLKFHGARTTFCRVIKGRLYDFNSDLAGTVRCLKSAMNFRKFLNKSAKVRQGTGPRPSGNRTTLVRAPDDVLCVELPPIRSDVYLQKYRLHIHRYFYFEDQKHKYRHGFCVLFRSTL